MTQAHDPKQVCYICDVGNNNDCEYVEVSNTRNHKMNKINTWMLENHAISTPDHQDKRKSEHQNLENQYMDAWKPCNQHIRILKIN